MSSQTVLRALLAASSTPTSLIPTLKAILESGDAKGLALLRAGVELHKSALKEKQATGIRKAQLVVKKYKGRKPGALGLSQAKQDHLSDLLSNGEPNISKAARDLKLSRSTVYRYIQMAPKLVEVLRLAKKAKGQKARGDADRQAQTIRKVEQTFSAARTDAGLKVSNRPLLDAVRAERKRPMRIDPTSERSPLEET